MPGMTAHEHAMHMHVEQPAETATTTLPEPDLPPAPPATIQGDEEIVQAGVRLTDLPSTMAMVAVSNPAAIAELDDILFPSAPVAAPNTPFLATGRSIALELPPPRVN
jgi:hypothetical protein